jgi:hypothetical protein
LGQLYLAIFDNSPLVLDIITKLNDFIYDAREVGEINGHFVQKRDQLETLMREFKTFHTLNLGHHFL